MTDTNQIEQIARTHLGIDTLTERKSDRLDFYDLGVLSIKKALEAAFAAGQAQAQATGRGKAKRPSTRAL